MVLFDVDKKSMVQYTKQFYLKHPVDIMLRLTFNTSVKIMRTDKQQNTLMAWIPVTRKVTAVFLFLNTSSNSTTCKALTLSWTYGKLLLSFMEWLFVTEVIERTLLRDEIVFPEKWCFHFLSWTRLEQSIIPNLSIRCDAYIKVL